GPARPDIERLAAENTVDIGLGGSAVNVTFRPPVIFGDGDGRSCVVISVHPVAEPRNELYLVVDPGLVHVVRIPERARGFVARQLHGGRRFVAEFTSLRIVVDA